MSAVLAAVMTWKGYLIVSESPTPMGSIERSAHDGLQTIITDNVQDGRFEATVGDQGIGRQPYRRYRGHVVLMATEVDPQWRDRGVSSAMISGVLALIRRAGHTVVPRCKITADYILRHPEYRDLVPDQYQGLLRPVSRPAAPAAPDSAAG
jgi:predicted GNAT family acetyltransferase